MLFFYFIQGFNDCPISAVMIDAELGNLMENSVTMERLQHKPHNSHPVICLYKQECNHGTCLKFPRNVAGILMHLFDLYSDAPNPTQSSVV